MAESRVYLGKAGRFAGPFSESAIAEMRRSGAISDYTWIWNEEKGAWQPVEVPPPPPPTAAGARASGAQEEMPEDWEVICHDRRSALPGRLRNMTETGAFFVAPTEALSPSLLRGANASLSLFDKKKGSILSHPVRVIEVLHDSDGWVYQVSWASVPQL